MSDIITSKKELARRLGRNPRYVQDMTRGGFQMPCREDEAVAFLRRNPHPAKFRNLKARHGQ
jgi:hypothetical protein